MRIHTHNSIGKRLFGRGPLAGAVIFHSPLPIYSLPALSPPSPLFFHLRAYVCVVCVCGRVCVCVGVFNNSCKVRKGKRYTRSRHCWWGSPSFLSFSFHLTIFSSPSSSAFVIPFQKLFPTLRNLPRFSTTKRASWSRGTRRWTSHAQSLRTFTIHPYRLRVSSPCDWNVFFVLFFIFWVFDIGKTCRYSDFYYLKKPNYCGHWWFVLNNSGFWSGQLWFLVEFVTTFIIDAIIEHLDTIYLLCLTSAFTMEWFRLEFPFNLFSISSLFSGYFPSRMEGRGAQQNSGCQTTCVR